MVGLRAQVTRTVPPGQRDRLHDLLLPAGRQLRAVEIKAGATVNADYFRGLRSFAAAFPDVLEGGNVVYGGEAFQTRSDWPVIPWSHLQSPPPP